MAERYPGPVFKYLYWSSATLVSVASLVSFRLFWKNNFISPTKTSLDFKLALAWHGLRAFLAVAQIYIHPHLFPLRAGDGINPKGYTKRAKKTLIEPGETKFGALVETCNWALRLFMIGSLSYCVGLYRSVKLNSTMINIKLELFQMG